MREGRGNEKIGLKKPGAETSGRLDTHPRNKTEIPKNRSLTKGRKKRQKRCLDIDRRWEAGEGDLKKGTLEN